MRKTLSISGTETLAALTLTVLNTTEEALASFDPIKRDCYTETEFHLKYMDWAKGFRYSMINCLYESVLEHVIDNCKCIPSLANFKLITEPMLTKCQGKDLTCAKEWMNDFGNPNTTINGFSYDLTIANTNETTIDYTIDGIIEVPINKTCKERCEHQDQMITSTNAPYPNPLTFPYREEFCQIMRKIAWRICKDDQRKKAFETRYTESMTCEKILTAHEQGNR